ncbi:MAG: thioether cross-link-forming SCIFF peptide maturase [Clostridiales Family XIII bacterium]|nr:thioether cross-link-forming SCIFF peptide maturase [Clostridiales Family XIII bacterium]
MIHKYRFQELNIVLDVNSGAVHVVSDAASDLLDHWRPGLEFSPDAGHGFVEALPAALIRRHSRGALEDAFAEISVVIADGTLFSREARFADDVLERRGAVIKAMCLHAAHDCNMRCVYCFGDGGSFGGVRSSLSEDTGRLAVDFLLEKSGARKNLEIDFFGGEPLLNFEVIRRLVAYGREREQQYGKNIRFTVTTNGLLLDEEKEAYINEHMDNVILSIDGRPHVNDRMRKTPDGGGSYDLITDNYLRFGEKRKGSYYLRGTFTRENLDFSEDVKHLADMGFPAVSMEPVFADEACAYTLRDADIPAILLEYDRLADLCLAYAKAGKPFVFFHFNIDLEQGPCAVKRVSGCGAGAEYVAVSPEGDIYPCHRFVGNAAFKIGNVRDGSFENKLFDIFSRAHIYSKEACKRCWAKFYCGGGCHANAWLSGGSILKPYELGCEMEKKRIDCAIGIRAALSEPG